MRRFTTAEEVSEAIAFLADEARAAYVTGACLPVDGGHWLSGPTSASSRRSGAGRPRRDDERRPHGGRKARPAIPEKYAKALGEDDPVEVMADTPGRLRRLVRGLTARQLATKPAREVVDPGDRGAPRRRRGDPRSRYRFIAAHNRPPIAGYDQDSFVERLGVARRRPPT